MRISLGTAQFGGRYGITNRRGDLRDRSIKRIFQVATRAGISDLDTALAYGNSLARIRPYIANHRVTSKVLGKEQIGPQVDSVLARLGVQRVEAMLIHDWANLNVQESEVAVGGLLAEHGRGRVGKVGVSIYQEEEIERALIVFSAFDTTVHKVQVPASPLDQRLLECDIIQHLIRAGTEISIRSIFLQGVLLGQGHRFSQHPDVVKYHACRLNLCPNWTSLEFCLAHAKSLSWANEVVIGVTSNRELTQICTSWDSVPPQQAPIEVASRDRDLVDPRRWCL